MSITADRERNIGHQINQDQEKNVAVAEDLKTKPGRVVPTGGGMMNMPGMQTKPRKMKMLEHAKPKKATTNPNKPRQDQTNKKPESMEEMMKKNPNMKM